MVNEILSLLNWVKDKLPIQDRKERWRNEYDKLKRERSNIIIHKADVEKARRLDYINRRIDVLEQLFRNQKSD